MTIADTNPLGQKKSADFRHTLLGLTTSLNPPMGRSALSAQYLIEDWISCSQSGPRW